MLNHVKLFHFNPLQIKDDLPCAKRKNMLEMQPNLLSGSQGHDEKNEDAFPAWIQLVHL